MWSSSQCDRNQRMETTHFLLWLVLPHLSNPTFLFLLVLLKWNGILFLWESSSSSSPTILLHVSPIWLVFLLEFNQKTPLTFASSPLFMASLYILQPQWKSWCDVISAWESTFFLPPRFNDSISKSELAHAQNPSAPSPRRRVMRPNNNNMSSIDSYPETFDSQIKKYAHKIQEFWCQDVIDGNLCVRLITWICVSRCGIVSKVRHRLRSGFPSRISKVVGDYWKD